MSFAVLPHRTRRTSHGSCRTSCRCARHRRRIAVHQGMPALRRRLPAGLPRHRSGDRRRLHARRRMLVLRPVRGALPDRRGHRQHALSAPMSGRWKGLALALAGVLLAGCAPGNAATGGTIEVVIGYQSKTINTVTAGTLLRSLGYFEQRLTDAGKRTGRTYHVVWQDYSTGAPITAQMVAGKIDIGSMGDYPLLINGSRTQQFGDGRTELVSTTGYNLRGALNMIVVGANSAITNLTQLKGQNISASAGSAGHGTTVHALQRAGLDPESDVRIQNQVPAVGASALQSGSV